MPITREFIDWSQPALPAVVDHLCGRYLRDDVLDLDQVVLVFPGGRAGRRLLELLVEHAARRGLILRPPRRCTVGQLPELLYEPQRPFAGELVQRLAWVQALRETGPDACEPFIPQLPDADHLAGWMELGALLQRQHRELAADALDFAEVARRGPAVAGFRESPRWMFLSTVQQRYLAILDELGLWDLQTARLVAIGQRECRTNQDIVLVATTDMNVATRRMLDQVADRVTALIHAPGSLADRFDEHGCLVPDAWHDAPIDLRTEQVHVVQGPAEQAEAVVATIAGYGGRYRADQIVVGVLDEQLVPHLLQKLHQAQLPARWVVGQTVGQTAPYKLLEAWADVIRYGDRFVDFAALVRHPDVVRYVESGGAAPNWLAELDAYYSAHLPPRVGQWVGAGGDHEQLKQVVARIQDVARPLTGGSRTLADWAEPIAGLLSACYGNRVLAADDPDQYYTLKSLEHLRDALVEFQRVPARIAPRVTAPDAIGQLLEQVGGAQIPAPHAPHQIELLGWLELPLDMAPALVATSFNEGFVPTSVNSDLFLPNALRQQLDLLDNRRRYARDAYALSVLLASREDLTLIAGRRTGGGDPLIPSRLAFAADPETMARRAKAFFRADVSGAPGPRGGRAGAVAGKSRFVIRKPPRLARPLTTIRVTGFRDYLTCPYRFYLRHVLDLAPQDDAARELGPDTFGTLLHDVLQRFGRDPAMRRETDPAAISRYLHHELNQSVTSRYGQDHLPAVAVQALHAQARLDAFACWQAKRARDGWEIRYVESSGGSAPACLPLRDGVSVTLRGRIDRIDCRDGQWAILDYKTDDTKKTPQETHLQGGQWVDLQLPLYLHLARTLGIDGPMQLGYIVLPKDVSQVEVLMADWDSDLLAEADQRAIDVAQRIYDQEFWPPATGVPRTLTEYAVICQDYALRRNLEEDLMAEADPCTH